MCCSRRTRPTSSGWIWRTTPAKRAESSQNRPRTASALPREVAQTPTRAAASRADKPHPPEHEEGDGGAGAEPPEDDEESDDGGGGEERRGLRRSGTERERPPFAMAGRCTTLRRGNKRSYHDARQLLRTALRRLLYDDFAYCDADYCHACDVDDYYSDFDYTNGPKSFTLPSAHTWCKCRRTIGVPHLVRREGVGFISHLRTRDLP